MSSTCASRRPSSSLGPTHFDRTTLHRDMARRRQTPPRGGYGHLGWLTPPREPLLSATRAYRSIVLLAPYGLSRGGWDTHSVSAGLVVPCGVCRDTSHQLRIRTRNLHQLPRRSDCPGTVTGKRCASRRRLTLLTKMGNDKVAVRVPDAGQRPCLVAQTGFKLVGAPLWSR